MSNDLHARWGQLPPLSSVSMHDMLATAVAVSDAASSGGDLAGDDLPEGRQRPAANGLLGRPRERRFEEPATSPFYETLKVLLKDELEAARGGGSQDQQQLEERSTEHASAYRSPVAKQLRDSVILMLTHVGFDQARNECIDVLTDLLAYYLDKFCSQLRLATDTADLSTTRDFIDPLVKVLQQMCVPDLEALRRYNAQLMLYEIKAKSGEV